MNRRGFLGSIAAFAAHCFGPKPAANTIMFRKSAYSEAVASLEYRPIELIRISETIEIDWTDADFTWPELKIDPPIFKS